jgi:hypothetical protein
MIEYTSCHTKAQTFYISKRFQAVFALSSRLEASRVMENKEFKVLQSGLFDTQLE